MFQKITHMQTSAHILVSGIVQGVGFRYFVQRHAVRLGLTGFVRNLPGGDVEIVAEGDKGLVEEFTEYVRIGPRSAHVRNVNVAWGQPTHEFRAFECE